MDATPKTRKSLFDGLTRILHLHQLPQKEKGSNEVVEHTPWKDQSGLSTPSSSREPIPSIQAVSSSRVAPTPLPPVTPARSPAPIVLPSSANPAAPATKVAPPAKPQPVSAPVKPVPVVRAPEPSAPTPMVMVSRGMIVTDYDRIYELVRTKQSIKLDEIARVLALKEERVAQELQTLEDNGMVDVRYPAFGEPLIVYKKPEA